MPSLQMLAPNEWEQLDKQNTSATIAEAGSGLEHHCRPLTHAEAQRKLPDSLAYPLSNATSAQSLRFFVVWR